MSEVNYGIPTQLCCGYHSLLLSHRYYCVHWGNCKCVTSDDKVGIQCHNGAAVLSSLLGLKMVLCLISSLWCTLSRRIHLLFSQRGIDEWVCPVNIISIRFLKWLVLTISCPGLSWRKISLEQKYWPPNRWSHTYSICSKYALVRQGNELCWFIVLHSFMHGLSNSEISTANHILLESQAKYKVIG